MLLTLLPGVLGWWALLLSLGVPIIGSSGSREEGGNQGCTGTSTMPIVVWLVGSVTEDGEFGPRVMGVLASGRRVPGPTAIAGQLSVAAGAAVAGRRIMHASSPATARLSGSMRSEATAGELKLVAPCLLFPQSCFLSVICSTHL